MASSPLICAQESSVGLLLARVSHARPAEILESPSVVQYETLWVVRDASGAHIAVTLPDVIVPRKTGFWRLGIAHTCQLDPPSLSRPAGPGMISTGDFAYAVPAEHTPVVRVDYNGESKPCDTENARRVFDESFQLYADERPDEPFQCSWENLWFLTVLPDLVSISYARGNSDNCDSASGHHSRWRNWVQSPDDLLSPHDPTQPHKHIPFNQIFGDKGEQAWIRAVTADPCLAEAPQEELDDRTGWSLHHSDGEWHAQAFAQQGLGCGVSAYPRVTVPRSLTHGAPLPVPWLALKKQLPAISDAYVSPSGSILVAILSAQNPERVVSIALFDFSKNKLGSKLLELPAGDVVMTEWATGRFVQSWTDTLTALKSHGLPTVVLEPSSVQ